MVYAKNGELSPQALILGELRRRAGEGVSGEALGRMLGVSRVAVWKRIRALAALGYPLTGDEGGYRLGEEGGDFLFPWEFGEQEGLFRHWGSTDSTMNRAAELAAAGAAGGTVVTAEVQTAGKGRNGRNWVSGPGGLFFTLLERPGGAVQDYPRHALACHLALGRAAAALCGKEVRLRWPNDVYAGGRKIAGLLMEFHASAGRIIWLTAGIGVNVNEGSAPEGAVSCAELRGRPLSRRALLLRFLEELRILNGTTPGELARLWNREAEGIGRRVLALAGEDSPEKEGAVRDRGVFLGVDALGRGLLRREEGASASAWFPGEVSFRFVE